MVRMPSLAAALAAAFLAVASMADRSAGGGRTVAVDAGWIAEPPPGASAAAGYVLIGNDASQDDVLLAARTAIARRTELHVTAVDDSGTMRMRAARDGMGIAGGGRLVLEPGGSHLMFIGLTARPQAGDTHEVVLTFARAGDVGVTFVVRRLQDHAGHAGHDAADGGHGQ